MRTMEVHRDVHFSEVLKITTTATKHALDASAAVGTVATTTRKRKNNSPHAYGEQVEKKKKIQPRIIHTVCPPLIHAEPSNFMRIVQRLTGCAVTRLRCDELNRGSGASPTSTICGAASSSCTSTSTSTDEQQEASFSAPNLRLLHQASSGPQVFPNDEEDIHLECNFLVSANKGDDHEASSSPVLMSSYEGEHETISSSALLITRHGEDEVCSSPAFLNNYEGEQETSSSACNSSGSGLQLEGNFGLFDSRSCGGDDDDHLFYLDTQLYNATPLGLNSSVDSFLEHLLFSYDHNVPCKYTSTSSILADDDVCDPSLLKDLS